MADDPMCPACAHPKRRHDKGGCCAAGGECICPLTATDFAPPAPAPAPELAPTATVGEHANPAPVASHYQTAGWGGVPGECGVECACGTTFDHFGTIAEAAALLDDHIAAANLPTSAAEPEPEPAAPPVIEPPTATTEPDDYGVDDWVDDQLEGLRNVDCDAGIGVRQVLTYDGIIDVPGPVLVDEQQGASESIAALLDKAEGSGSPQLMQKAADIRLAVAALEHMLATDAKRAALEEEVERLRQQLAEAEARLREVSGGGAPKPVPPAGGPSNREVRNWAWANNVECPARGTVPRRVMKAYRAAHPEVASV